jgi:transposase
MTNERERQTYFGALEYGKKEFLVQAYPTANYENTVKFLKYLQSQRPDQRIAVIWDGAIYHKSEQVKEYLESINSGLEESQWQITCILFAPNAPEQNSVEDIWLQAKNFVREYYHLCKSFQSVKKLFTLVNTCEIF